MPRPLLALALLCASVPALAATPCPSASSFQLADTTITLSEAVESGKLTTPYGDPLANLPAFCRVAGVLRPTKDSVIRFEVWLPAAGWNGRYLGVGNGGFAGTIGYGQMASALRLGYATGGTDTGHQGGAEDASWAYRHPEKVTDYGYRALHRTTENAKRIVAAVYSKPADHAYFDACSNGGREALMEAQRFPKDFDGILAGAPANNWTRMLASGIDVNQTMLADPAGYIPAMKLPAINRAALEACDALDGVKDGIVSQPALCRFDVRTLVCKAEDNLNCLTEPQAWSLIKLYRGGSTRDRTPLFPGYVPGGEIPAWSSWIIGNGPGGGSGGRYAENYFRYMVLSDPKWSLLEADPAAMLEKANAATGKALNAVDPDLAPFFAHGGKLILYHGWNDPAISPWNTVNYLKSVQKKLGAEATDQSVRLYMVPGMEHCAGGPGPSSFGQFGLPGGAGKGSGMLDLLELWVESGKAPGPVIASKTAAGKTTMTRPLCPYPQVAKWDGTGDPNLASSFACKAE